MDEPEVSLILPTQGARPSLAGALESALAQDFPSLKIVIVDDARTDSTWPQRGSYASWLSDPRVRVVSFRQGRGCAAAKNAGLRAARGRWVCYLDDDNEYRPDKVGAQHALALATGSPLVLCGLEFRIEGRRRLRQVDCGSYEGDRLLIDALADTNVLFHRRHEGVLWDESLGTADDACFFHAYLAKTGLKSVPNVPRPLVVYHAHRGSRANRSQERLHQGQRRLVVRWSHGYGRRARRVLVMRVLVSSCKFRSGRWFRLMRMGCGLIRIGGWREWRFVANAAGVKLPGIRRWMIT